MGGLLREVMFCDLRQERFPCPALAWSCRDRDRLMSLPGQLSQPSKRAHISMCLLHNSCSSRMWAGMRWFFFIVLLVPVDMS
ncbi:unnamed protein product [Musa textilis]